VVLSRCERQSRKMFWAVTTTVLFALAAVALLTNRMALLATRLLTMIPPAQNLKNERDDGSNQPSHEDVRAAPGSRISQRPEPNREIAHSIESAAFVHSSPRACRRSRSTYHLDPADASGSSDGLISPIKTFNREHLQETSRVIS